MADSIGKLCRGLLPAEFERNRKLLPSLERFFETHLPEPLNRSVTLLRADEREIVIAAASPPLASYLRLHAREIEQQLRETLGSNRTLKVRAMPAAATRLAPPARPAVPRPVGADAIHAFERSADWIEDPALREALLALASAMKEAER